MNYRRMLVAMINGFLSHFDLRISRKSHFPRDWRNHFAHMRTLGFECRTIFDVGVATQTEDLYDAYPGAEIVLVEPLEEYKPALAKIVDKYSAHLELAAAGENVGSVVINVPRALGASTVYDTPEMAITDFEPRTVPMTTLDTIWASNEFEGPVLIKLDVQGAELDVLKGSVNLLQSTEVLIVETNLFESFEGSPLFIDHVNYMYNKGFVVYDIIGGGYSESSRRLGFVDLVYVRKDSSYHQDKSNFTKDDLHKVLIATDGIKRKP